MQQMIICWNHNLVLVLLQWLRVMFLCVQPTRSRRGLLSMSVIAVLSMCLSHMSLESWVRSSILGCISSVMLFICKLSLVLYSVGSRMSVLVYGWFMSCLCFMFEVYMLKTRRKNVLIGVVQMYLKKLMSNVSLMSSAIKIYLLVVVID